MDRRRSTNLAKRYAELADALERLSTHYRLDNRGALARDHQLTASELRTAEHIPPDPSDLDGVATTTRDSIAEWRAFGRIEELENLEEKRPYLNDLTEIAKVGPVTAQQLHKDKGAETIEDIKELNDQDELEEVSGIGPKTATTIRRSIAQK